MLYLEKKRKFLTLINILRKKIIKSMAISGDAKKITMLNKSFEEYKWNTSNIKIIKWFDHIGTGERIYNET